MVSDACTNRTVSISVFFVSETRILHLDAICYLAGFPCCITIGIDAAIDDHIVFTSGTPEFSQSGNLAKPKENDRQIVNKMVQKGVLVGDFDVMTVESSGTPVKE